MIRRVRFDAIYDICDKNGTYKLYFYANYGLFFRKNFFDKQLDNDFTFGNLANILN